MPIYRHFLLNPKDLTKNPFPREASLVLSLVSPRSPETPQINNFCHLWAISCHVRKTYYLLHFSYISLLPTSSKYKHFGYVKSTDILIYWYITLPVYRHIPHNPQDLKENSFAREVILVVSWVPPRWPETPKINHLCDLWAMSCHVRNTYYLLHYSYISLLPTTSKYQHLG
jgi:hypothetical protein